MIDTVASALEQRWPQSRKRGREGTPAEVVLRMLILKHLHDWSFDELEQEVRANLVYRAFTRIGVDAVPDAKTILKIAKALGPEVITDLHQRVVEVAKRAGVTHGRRFRIDTTVVETNVHTGQLTPDKWAWATPPAGGRTGPERGRSRPHSTPSPLLLCGPAGTERRPLWSRHRVLLAVLAVVAPPSSHWRGLHQHRGGVEIAQALGLMTRSAVGSPFGSPLLLLSGRHPSTDRQEET